MPPSESAIARPPAAGPGPARPAAAPRWFLWVAWLTLAGYAVFLGVNTTVVAGGSDSSGYLNSARLFAEGRLRTELRVPPEMGGAAAVVARHFAPQGYNVFAGRHDLAPTYPTGLPLHLAVAGRIAGWRAGPFLVQLLGALVAVWLLYVTARRLGVGYELAAAGAVVLAAFPVFIFTSIQTLSDTLATTWMLAAFYAALRVREQPRTASGGRWAFGCGVALAVAVLVRPTNLVLAPGLVVLLGWDWRTLGRFGLGGLPGAIWLGWYNHHLYGGVLRSGYGNVAPAFDAMYVAPTAVHFVKWTAILLPAVLLVLPWVALGRRDTRGRAWWALVLAGAAVTGLYLFYDVSHDVWWCLRFILPAVAALILVALLGAEALARGAGARWPRVFRPGLALLLAGWAAAGSWHWTRNLHVLWVSDYELAYARAAEVVQARVPPEALVVCSVFSGALYYATPAYSLVYDILTPGEFTRYAGLARGAGRPIYAVLFDLEEEDAMKRCPGDWERIATVRNIGLWRLR